MGKVHLLKRWLGQEKPTPLFTALSIIKYYRFYGLNVIRLLCLLSGFNILKNALALVCIIGSYNGKEKTFLRYLDEIEHWRKHIIVLSLTVS